MQAPQLNYPGMESGNVLHLMEPIYVFNQQRRERMEAINRRWDQEENQCKKTRQQKVAFKPEDELVSVRLFSNKDDTFNWIEFCGDEESEDCSIEDEEERENVLDHSSSDCGGGFIRSPRKNTFTASGSSTLDFLRSLSTNGRVTRGALEQAVQDQSADCDAESMYPGPEGAGDNVEELIPDSQAVNEQKLVGILKASEDPKNAQPERVTSSERKVLASLTPKSIIKASRSISDTAVHSRRYQLQTVFNQKTVGILNNLHNYPKLIQDVKEYLVQQKMDPQQIRNVFSESICKMVLEDCESGKSKWASKPKLITRPRSVDSVDGFYYSNPLLARFARETKVEIINEIDPSRQAKIVKRKVVNGKPTTIEKSGHPMKKGNDAETSKITSKSVCPNEINTNRAETSRESRPSRGSKLNSKKSQDVSRAEDDFSSSPPCQNPASSCGPNSPGEFDLEANQMDSVTFSGSEYFRGMEEMQRSFDAEICRNDLGFVTWLGKKRQGSSPRDSQSPTSKPLPIFRPRTCATKTFPAPPSMANQNLVSPPPARQTKPPYAIAQQAILSPSTSCTSQNAAMFFTTVHQEATNFPQTWRVGTSATIQARLGGKLSLE